MLFSQTGYDVDLVRRTVATLVDMHDALRTRFRLGPDGDCVQYLIDNRPTAACCIERLIDTGPGEADTIHRAMREIQNRINVFDGPLFGVGLFKTHGGDHLYFVIHHLISDACSLKILVTDFIRLYRLHLSDRAAHPARPASFTGLIRHLQNYARSASRAADSVYWSALTATGAPSLPVDNHIDSNLRKDRHNRCIHRDLFGRAGLVELKNNLRINGVREQDFYLSCIGLCLCEWIDCRHIILKVSHHGRCDNPVPMHLGRTIGPLWVTYPVLIDDRRPEDPLARAVRVRGQLDAMPDNGRSYEALVELDHDNRQIAENDKAIGGILFNYYSTFHDLTVWDRHFGQISPYFDDFNRDADANSGYVMIFNLREMNNGLYLQVCYNQHEFRRRTVERLYNAIRDYCLASATRLGANREIDTA